MQHGADTFEGSAIGSFGNAVVLRSVIGSVTALDALGSKMSHEYITGVFTAAIATKPFDLDC